MTRETPSRGLHSARVSRAKIRVDRSRGDGQGGKASEKEKPGKDCRASPRRGELRCGVPVVWLPDFRLQPHFFSMTSRANHSQANLSNSTPTDAPCKKNATKYYIRRQRVFRGLAVCAAIFISSVDLIGHPRPGEGHRCSPADTGFWVVGLGNRDRRNVFLLTACRLLFRVHRVGKR